MTDDIRNIDLFIKLMKLTTSSHEGEVLSAIRKANAMLSRDGYDWEAVLRSKIKLTIVEDPFAKRTVERAERQAPPPPPSFAPQNGAVRSKSKPTPPPSWTPPVSAPPKPGSSNHFPTPGSLHAPLSMTKNSSGHWCLRSPVKLAFDQKVNVAKRNGDLVDKIVKNFSEQNSFGDFLYFFIDATTTATPDLL